MICGAIQNLIDYGIKYRLITDADELVVRNELMDALRLTDWKDGVPAEECETIDEILQPLVDYACKQGIITDTVSRITPIVFTTQILKTFERRRSMNCRFHLIHNLGPHRIN